MGKRLSQAEIQRQDTAGAAGKYTVPRRVYWDAAGESDDVLVVLAEFRVTAGGSQPLKHQWRLGTNGDRSDEQC